MRLFPLVTFGLLVSAAVWAAENPQLTAARERVKKIRMLVEAGAASRAQLTQAEEEVADAEDDALVSGSFRVGDLTEEQAEAVSAAAQRRVGRRVQALDKARQLVDDGLATASSVAPLQADLDFARQELDLAQEVVTLTRQLSAMARAEEAMPAVPQAAASPELPGFGPEILASIESAYQSRFGKPLPISANGETAVHRALGFDHTGRVDVALNPDQAEGVWLRDYLDENHIPYFAFRQAVPGKSTGAHIHLGPQSARLVRGAAASGAE